MTLGHANILQRSLCIFDEVTVMVANDPKKTYLFSIEERVEIVKLTISDIEIPKGKRVYVQATDAIVADYINNKKIGTIIRGIRNATDLDHEFQLEQYNQIVSIAETIYLSPRTEHLNTSSTLVRMFLQSGKIEQSKIFLSPSAYQYVILK